MLQFLNLTAESIAHDAGALDKLIAGTASGDDDAFALLYERTKVSVYSYALSILKHPQDAEDVMHDCFVRIYLNASGYASSGKPMAWILTITKRLCYEKLAERSRVAALTDEEWEQAYSDNGGLSNDDVMTIRRLVELLGDEERSIVILHAVSGFRHREIAEFLKLPLSTVLSRYHRAAKKLKAAYIQDENANERIPRAV